MELLTYSFKFFIRQKKTSLMILFNFTCLVFIPVAGHAGLETPNPARHLEVTKIKGESLSFLLGKNTKDYSVMVVDTEELIPIPYQFDDKNVKGLTFVPGGKLTISGAENIMDAEDELIFMYKDMSEQASAEVINNLEGAVIAEFSIHEDDVSRFAYLVSGNSQRSKKRYTNYDFDTGLLDTETYSLQFDPDNIITWSDWKIKGFTGTDSAPNILDTMKARVFARMGFLKTTLGNNLIPARTLAVKNGPVRSIVEADVSIAIFGIDLLSGGVSVTFTAQTVEYPIFAVIPKAADVLSEFRMDVTLDYVDFDGSRYRTALGPKEPLITGQEVSDNIREQYKSDLDNPWVAISTGKNWDMIFLFRHPDDFRPILSALYRDKKAGDKVNKPERFKGSSSELGVRLENIPTGAETYLEYSLFFGPDLWQGNNPDKAAYDIEHPAEVTITPMILNTAVGVRKSAQALEST